MVLSRAAAGVGAGPYHITSYHLVGNLITLPSRTSYMTCPFCGGFRLKVTARPQQAGIISLCGLPVSVTDSQRLCR